MAATKAPKARMVISATMNPRAECITPDCGKTWPYSSFTTADAKEHAAARDHVVLVIRETRTEYVRA